MCGLAGFLAGMPAPEESGGDVVARMLERMRHRCPDGDGRWQECGVALGHRRLAIIDLDVRAAQPMHSIDGRYVIVYHGEIYNYRSLRRELEAAGTPFRTTSDTEVILALFADRGEAMLPRLHGMFAFVIWDRSFCQIWCTRVTMVHTESPRQFRIISFRRATKREQEIFF